MAHFTAAELVDFVRNPASAGHSDVRRHLAEGCAECQQLCDLWKEVSEIGLREARYCPPEDAVRAVKAAFAVQRSWRGLREAAQRARLMFDSLLEPAPVEIRGSAIASRQFLHEATPFVIDLRVECEPARNRVRLNGQVLNSNDPDQDVADVDVFLLKGETLATKTHANVSGEFDLDFPDQEDLRLFIDIRGQKVIEIGLPASLADCRGSIKEPK